MILAPFLFIVAAATAPPASQGGIPEARAPLKLADAVQAALVHQPQLLQARAQTEAAQARAAEATAPLLPQLNFNGSYQKTTSNFIARPGALPSNIGATSTASFQFRDFFSFGLTATQLIFDFGDWARSRAGGLSAQAQRASEAGTERTVVLNAESAFFGARAQKDLVQVAQETLANQTRHLEQIQGFVEVGTRPAIDLAQARTDRANAQVQLINAQNGYEIAKAQLNQAMGVEASTDFELADDDLPVIQGEEGPADALVSEAAHSRPEMAALDLQVRAQDAFIQAAYGGYLPALSAQVSGTEAGPSLSNLTWNVGGQLTLTWNLFQGLLTQAQVREAKANLRSTQAQRDLLHLQVRLEVDQARLNVRGARAAVDAAKEALVNARERLRLAEGRYQTGVGSIIELGDAQVALTNAAAQEVQARFNLSSARAQLSAALGRRL